MHSILEDKINLKLHLCYAHAKHHVIILHFSSILHLHFKGMFKFNILIINI